MYVIQIALILNQRCAEERGPKAQSNNGKQNKIDRMVAKKCITDKLMQETLGGYIYRMFNKKQTSSRRNVELLGDTKLAKKIQSYLMLKGCYGIIGSYYYVAHFL